LVDCHSTSVEPQSTSVEWQNTSADLHSDLSDWQTDRVDWQTTCPFSLKTPDFCQIWRFLDSFTPVDGKTNVRTKIAQPFKAGMLAHSFQKSCKDDRQVLSSLRDFGFCAITSPALKCWAISRNQPERPNTSYNPKKERRSDDRRCLNDPLWGILQLFRHRRGDGRAVGVLVADEFSAHGAELDRQDVILAEDAFRQADGGGGLRIKTFADGMHIRDGIGEDFLIGLVYIYSRKAQR
jgi:hypothetical protein